MRNEFLGRQIRPAQIPARQSIAANAQFTDHASRHGVLISVENEDTGVCNRPPDRYGGSASFDGCVRAGFVDATTNYAFRWSILVEEPQRRRMLSPPPDSSRRKVLTTDHECLHGLVPNGLLPTPPPYQATGGG